MAKYDWKDGKGAVHSRPKRKRLDDLIGGSFVSRGVGNPTRDVHKPVVQGAVPPSVKPLADMIAKAKPAPIPALDGRPTPTRRGGLANSYRDAVQSAPGIARQRRQYQPDDFDMVNERNTSIRFGKNYGEVPLKNGVMHVYEDKSIPPVFVPFKNAEKQADRQPRKRRRRKGQRFDSYGEQGG